MAASWNPPTAAILSKDLTPALSPILERGGATLRHGKDENAGNTSTLVIPGPATRKEEVDVFLRQRQREAGCAAPNLRAASKDRSLISISPDRVAIQTPAASHCRLHPRAKTHGTQARKETLRGARTRFKAMANGFRKAGRRMAGADGIHLSYNQRW